MTTSARAIVSSPRSSAWTASANFSRRSTLVSTTATGVVVLASASRVICVLSISMGDTPVGTKTSDAADTAASMIFSFPGGVSISTKSAFLARCKPSESSLGEGAGSVGKGRGSSDAELHRIADCWGSESKTATLYPFFCIAVAKNMVTVVFPVPPFDCTTEIT